MISKKNTNGILNFKDVFGNGNKESDKILCEIENSIQFDDPVNIQFTSGTTGAAKGVVLTHFNVVNNALSAGRRYGYNIQTPITCCSPLFHTVGYVLCSLATMCFGGTIVMPSPAFDTVSCLKAIEKHECSIFYGTPTTFVDLIRNYQSGKFNATSLKQIIITGATCSSKILKNIKDVFASPRIAISYGSTETSPSIANTSIENFEKSDGYMKPYDYVEVKIINNEGHIVPVNTPGEISTRGYNTFQGYWEEEKKTAEVLDKARWYHTGDIGVMNDEGCIKIVGRIKDIIIRGGENIYPSDIENFLSNHPSVAEVHICGVPDERLVEEACAWICLKNGKHLTEKDVKEFFKGKISENKIPRYVMFVKDFPKTASGKIKKFEMSKISIEKLKLLLT